MTIDVTLLARAARCRRPIALVRPHLVQAGGQTFLFDAGRGLGMRLTAAGVAAPMLTTVFLTHLHSDHITDLNDVVTSRWVMSPAPNPPSRSSVRWAPPRWSTPSWRCSPPTSATASPTTRT
ncbi:MAG: MBL fold metallo-hydrolase [Acidimicrobiales bacterium]